jgi:hypothetical protein
MAKRRFLALLGFVTGLFAGSVLYRRSTSRRRERLDVYFDDGSMVSFVEGRPKPSACFRLRATSSPRRDGERSPRSGARRARLPRR